MTIVPERGPGRANGHLFILLVVVPVLRYSESMRTLNVPASIVELLTRSAEKHGSEPAISSSGDGLLARLTYDELRGASLRFAKWALELGVKPGDRILIFSQNCPEWVVADFGMATAGAVSVPIHRTLSTTQIVDLIDQTAPIAALVSRECRQALELGLEFCGSCIPVIELEDLGEILSEVQGYSDTQQYPALNPESLASIIYTSGTTSTPRGARLLHRNFCTNAAAFAEAVPFGPGECFYSQLPLSHVFERVLDLYVPLLVGASVHYPGDEAKSHDGRPIASPTVMVCVPRLLEKLVAMAESTLGGFYSVKTVISGGAPLSQALAERIEALGVEVLQGYGLTETGPVVSVSRRGIWKPRSVGLPIETVELRQAADGELLVRGPSVMAGYLDEKDGDFLEDGWFPTGDIATIDDDGFVTLVGRKKDFIALSTGQKIAPREIEELLENLPEINQAIVVGEGRKHIVALLTLNDPSVFFREDGLKTISSQVDLALEHLPRTHRIRAFVLFSQPFNEEAGEITASGKLRRVFIQEKYASDIQNAYRNS